MQPGLPYRRSALDAPAYAQRKALTSVRAKERLKALGCRNPQTAKLLAAYASVGPAGLTMSEVRASSGLRDSSICSLRASALAKGWLMPMAATRKALDTGMDQGMCRITTDGIEALRKWKERS